MTKFGRGRMDGGQSVWAAEGCNAGQRRVERARRPSPGEPVAEAKPRRTGGGCVGPETKNSKSRFPAVISRHSLAFRVACEGEEIESTEANLCSMHCNGWENEDATCKRALSLPRDKWLGGACTFLHARCVSHRRTLQQPPSRPSQLLSPGFPAGITHAAGPEIVACESGLTLRSLFTLEPP